MHYGFLNEIFRDEFCVFSGLPSDKLIGRPEIAALNPCEAQRLEGMAIVEANCRQSHKPQGLVLYHCPRSGNRNWGLGHGGDCAGLKSLLQRVWLRQISSEPTDGFWCKRSVYGLNGRSASFGKGVRNHFANARTRSGHNSNFIVKFEHNMKTKTRLPPPPSYTSKSVLSERPLKTTFVPSCAKRLTMPSPIPLVPPVTTVAT